MQRFIALSILIGLLTGCGLVGALSSTNNTLEDVKDKVEESLPETDDNKSKAEKAGDKFFNYAVFFAAVGVLGYAIGFKFPPASYVGGICLTAALGFYALYVAVQLLIILYWMIIVGGVVVGGLWLKRRFVSHKEQIEVKEKVISDLATTYDSDEDFHTMSEEARDAYILNTGSNRKQGERPPEAKAEIGFK